MGDLNRFIKAQEKSYAAALEEIKAGQKKSHWMWFVFPQLRELGKSETALYYGIEDSKEAEDYIKDKILGKRLLEITAALLELETSNPVAVFGSPDDKKLRSSMTLFAAVSKDPVFQKVLDKFYDSEMDPLTLKILKKREGSL